MARGGKNARISAIVLGKGRYEVRALHKGNEGVRCAREAEKLFCIGFSHRIVRVSLGVSSGPILRAIRTTSPIQLLW